MNTYIFICAIGFSAALATPYKERNDFFDGLDLVSEIPLNYFVLPYSKPTIKPIDPDISKAFYYRGWPYRTDLDDFPRGFYPTREPDFDRYEDYRQPIVEKKFRSNGEERTSFIYKLKKPNISYRLDDNGEALPRVPSYVYNKKRFLKFN